MVRETLDYYDLLRKENPRFDDCPAPCAESEKDESDFCRVCPIAAAWSEFRESFNEQVCERLPGIKSEWSFEKLYLETVKVLKVDSRLEGRGYPSDSSALLARCLDIVRAEQYRIERIAKWERDQTRNRDD